MRRTSTLAMLSLIGQLWLSAGPAGAAAEPNQTIGVTDNEITLGSCAALSGQLKVRGTQVVDGGKAYFAYINEKGGVNGRQIKLNSCDDQYAPEMADACSATCLKGKVFAGTLFQGTPTAMRYVHDARSLQMPMVGFSSGAEFIANPVSRYVFQVRPTYADEAAAQVAFLLNKVHDKRIAVIYQNDAYGMSCRAAIDKELDKAHEAPIVEVKYERFATDVDPIMAKLRAARPDSVILAAAGSALTGIIKRRDEIGKSVRMITFSNATDPVVTELGKRADGLLITQILPVMDDNLPFVRLYRQMNSKYEHVAPSDSGLEGFLIAAVVTEGLKRAGRDLTRDRFVDALESIHNWDLGLGPQFAIDYSSTQHDAMRGHVSWCEIKNGRPTPMSGL